MHAKHEFGVFGSGHFNRSLHLTITYIAFLGFLVVVCPCLSVLRRIIRNLHPSSSECELSRSTFLFVYLTLPNVSQEISSLYLHFNHRYLFDTTLKYFVRIWLKA